jgi:hypothetical protein
MSQIDKNCNKTLRLWPCQVVERKINQYFKKHLCPFCSELNPRQNGDGSQNANSFAFQPTGASGRPGEIYCIYLPSKLELLY